MYGPDMRIYTQGELYSGSTWGIVRHNKKGKAFYGHKPLDPGWVRRSNELYHPKPQPEPPKPASQGVATQAAAGQGIGRPKKSKGRVSLADLRIRRPSKVNTQVALGAGGTGLNIGSFG